MKYLIISSIIGILAISIAFFILTRPSPSLTLEEYLEAVYCPEFQFGDASINDVLRHDRNSFFYLHSLVEAVEPPSELQPLHENLLEGLRLQGEAWEIQPVPTSDITKWAGYEKYVQGKDLVHHENATLAFGVVEAVDAYCGNRQTEPQSVEAVAWVRQRIHDSVTVDGITFSLLQSAELLQPRAHFDLEFSISNTLSHDIDVPDFQTLWTASNGELLLETTHTSDRSIRSGDSWGSLIAIPIVDKWAGKSGSISVNAHIDGEWVTIWELPFTVNQ